ncbi:carboxypeptidase regulatory-like domain-containing protein [bacterium]|nr:carboxypeptidase regulatory-like domain-containing protein [bacterium]
MKLMRILTMGLAIAAIATGCSRQEPSVAPQADDALVYHLNLDKNGTETLGTPSIAIADGSGFAEGGVGMVDTDSGSLEIMVPMGATINQVLAYWAGGTTGAPGDDNITLDGNAVAGDLIGGPTLFYSTDTADYHFSAYRADITELGLIEPGANTVAVTDFDFDTTGGTVDENNGVSIVVIYDDGATADLGLVDGLDLAFFQFAPTLDGTVPQTFTFGAEPTARTAQLLVIAGSVGDGRPNEVKVTTSEGDQVFTDVLGAVDLPNWDSILLDVNVPAGDTSLTVELFSTESYEPLGASLGWLASGLSVPRTPPEPAALGDRVWLDNDMNGIQDQDEPGVPGVTVQLLDCAGQVLAETTTDADGYYLFGNLAPGSYNVRFVRPDGFEFTLRDQGPDAEADSDADTATGETVCTVLTPGETDLSWDAGIYQPESGSDGCRMTGGGNSTFEGNSYTFGGQAGAPLASQPQPWGNWTHHQKDGPAGSFVFHAGTPSAPAGTEIDWIECMDPGWCVQARPAPAKQIDFAGVGTFKNMKGSPASIADNVTVGSSLHWFEVNVDDLGEPGGHDNPGGCDPLGFGRNGGTELADCDCPDFYRIRIHAGPTDASAVMYEVFGYIDNGNLQIHPPTGRDGKLDR